jgi:hypothetical protein
VPFGHVSNSFDSGSFPASRLTMQKKAKHIWSAMLHIPGFIIVEKLNFLNQFLFFWEENVVECFATFECKFSVVSWKPRVASLINRWWIEDKIS